MLLSGCCMYARYVIFTTLTSQKFEKQTICKLLEGGEQQPTARYRLCRTITKFDPAGGGLLDFLQNSRCLLSLFGVFGSFLAKKVEEKEGASDWIITCALFGQLMLFCISPPISGGEQSKGMVSHWLSLSPLWETVKVARATFLDTHSRYPLSYF